MNKKLILISIFALGLAGIVYTVSSTKQLSRTNQTSRTTNIPSTQPTAIADSSYNLAEVAKHTTGSDCWMAIDGSVYDVSKYTSLHPKGTDYLKGCGTDATSLFSNIRKHQSVTRILNSFKIGSLVN